MARVNYPARRQRRAARLVLEKDAAERQLGADAVGLGEVLGLARGDARCDQRLDLGGLVGRRP